MLVQANAIYSLLRPRLLADMPVKSKINKNGNIVSCFRNLILRFFKKIDVPKSKVRLSPNKLVIQLFIEKKSLINCGTHTITPTTMHKISTVVNDNIV